MIAGARLFVIAAYGVTFGGLALLALVIALRARAWANRARKVDTANRAATP